MSYRDIGLSEIERMPLQHEIDAHNANRKAAAEIALVVIFLIITTIVSFVVLPYCGIIKRGDWMTKTLWNLRTDDLEAQSPETISFVGKVLGLEVQSN